MRVFIVKCTPSRKSLAKTSHYCEIVTDPPFPPSPPPPTIPESNKMTQWHNDKSVKSPGGILINNTTVSYDQVFSPLPYVIRRALYNNNKYKIIIVDITYMLLRRIFFTRRPSCEGKSLKGHESSRELVTFVLLRVRLRSRPGRSHSRARRKVLTEYFSRPAVGHRFRKSLASERGASR